MVKMLLHYVQIWHLSDPQHLASTATSHVYTVKYHGTTVILKLLTTLGQEDEQGAAAALTWFAGRGAIRLWRHDAHALLLEYVAGDALTTLVAAGYDDTATHIIADVLDELHHPVVTPVLATLTPLPQRFYSLFVRAQQDKAAEASSIFGQAAAVAQALLAGQQEQYVLHGDLHHENIRYSAQRGWLAIDPKGIIGERAYDAANALCNPVTVPHLVQSAARLLKQADCLAAGLAITPSRLLAWVYVHACLAASWSLEDGTDPRHWLIMAHLVHPHVPQDLHKRGRL
jgi:streptomycin 6-kinase